MLEFAVGKTNESMSQEQVDLLFEAASAVLFSVIETEYCMKGTPVLVPEWVMPPCDPTCPCQMDMELVQEASNFLLRMGLLRVTDGGYLRSDF